MGKYGIGARVRDDDGDEGVIIDKRKGERRVRYDEFDDLLIWMAKDRLTVIEAAVWQPKVGDRVRWLGKMHASMLTKGNVYEIVKDYGRSPCPFGITDDNQSKGDHTTDAAWLIENFELVTEPTLTLRAGGYYTLRNGEVVGPLIDYGHSEFVFTIDPRVHDGDSWRVDGLWLDDLCERDRDIVAEAPAPVATLTIEAGKFYRTRDGRKVGPIRAEVDIDHYPFRGVECGGAGRDLWIPKSGEGVNWGMGYDTNLDIVAEWVEPVPVKAEPKFKKGDRVICVDETGGSWFRGKVGEVFVVDRIDGGIVIVEGSTGRGMYDYRFAPAPTDFQVGDVVRRVGESSWPEQFGAVGREYTVLEMDRNLPIVVAGCRGAAAYAFELVRRPPTPAPAFPVGTKVTLTGTVSGNNPVDKTNINVVVDGLPAGRNSLGISPAALTAA